MNKYLVMVEYESDMFKALKRPNVVRSQTLTIFAPDKDNAIEKALTEIAGSVKEKIVNVSVI